MHTISGKHKGTEINDRRTRSSIDNDELYNVPWYSCNIGSHLFWQAYGRSETKDEVYCRF